MRRDLGPDGEEAHELDGVCHYFNTAAAELLGTLDPFGSDDIGRSGDPHQRLGGNWSLRDILVVSGAHVRRLTPQPDDYELLWPE